jgi:hypothetical protein
MVDGFADIVKEPCPFGNGFILSEFDSHLPAKKAVSIECLQGILPVRGAEVESPKEFDKVGVHLADAGLKDGLAPISRMNWSVSTRVFSTISSILAGWILPSEIRVSTAISSLFLCGSGQIPTRRLLQGYHR